MSTDQPFWSEDEVRGMIEAGAYLNVDLLLARVHEIAADDAAAVVLTHFIVNWCALTLRANVNEYTGEVTPWSDEFDAIMAAPMRGAVGACLSILKRWPGSEFDIHTPMHDVEREVLAWFGIEKAAAE